MNTPKSLGDRRSVERADRKIAIYDLEIAKLHQVLFPPAIGSPLDGGPTRIVCDYCRVFEMTEDEAFERGGICPRCEGKPVDPRHPSWSPLLDGDPPTHRR